MNYDKYIEDLEILLRDKPGEKRVVRTLLTMLDRYLPSENGLGVYSDCQKGLSATFRETTWIDDVLNPTKVAEHYKKWQEFIDLRCGIIPITILQIFDGTCITINGVNTNCDLRFALFQEKNVISRLCHACYKVQVLLGDLTALMQIHFIFRRLNLPRNNARKCMIELREDVPYPYKAYIFCESEGEATSCFEKLNHVLRAAKISNVYCGLSHGCSEYGLKYPEFKYSSDGGHNLFERPASWDLIESEYWSVTPIRTFAGQTRKKLSLSIRDIIGYRTWIDYAEIIGDESWTLFRDAPSTNKPRGFADRVKKQSHLRNAQMRELQQRLLSTP